MGSIFGGPTTTPVPPPNPLFPGMQTSYINSLTNSGVTGTAFNTLNSMAQTGNPTNVGPAFQALQQSMQQGINQGATNLREQFGAAGLSGGSDMMAAGANYETQSTAQMNNALAQYTMQAQEAAANRQLTAATTGAQLASEPALAFTPSAVVSQQGGLLGGLATIFKTLFPGGASSLSSIFGQSATDSAATDALIGLGVGGGTDAGSSGLMEALMAAAAL